MNKFASSILPAITRCIDLMIVFGTCWTMLEGCKKYPTLRLHVAFGARSPGFGLRRPASSQTPGMPVFQRPKMGIPKKNAFVIVKMMINDGIDGDDSKSLTTTRLDGEIDLKRLESPWEWTPPICRPRFSPGVTGIVSSHYGCTPKMGPMWGPKIPGP